MVDFPSVTPTQPIQQLPQTGRSGVQPLSVQAAQQAAVARRGAAAQRGNFAAELANIAQARIARGGQQVAEGINAILEPQRKMRLAKDMLQASDLEAAVALNYSERLQELRDKGLSTDEYRQQAESELHSLMTGAIEASRRLSPAAQQNLAEALTQYRVRALTSVQKEAFSREVGERLGELDRASASNQEQYFLTSDPLDREAILQKQLRLLAGAEVTGLISPQDAHNREVDFLETIQRGEVTELVRGGQFNEAQDIVDGISDPQKARILEGVIRSEVSYQAGLIAQARARDEAAIKTVRDRVAAQISQNIVNGNPQNREIVTHALLLGDDKVRALANFNKSYLKADPDAPMSAEDTERFLILAIQALSGSGDPIQFGGSLSHAQQELDLGRPMMRSLLSTHDQAARRRNEEAEGRRYRSADRGEQVVQELLGEESPGLRMFEQNYGLQVRYIKNLALHEFWRIVNNPEFDGDPHTLGFHIVNKHIGALWKALGDQLGQFDVKEILDNYYSAPLKELNPDEIRGQLKQELSEGRVTEEDWEIHSALLKFLDTVVTVDREAAAPALSDAAKKMIQESR